MRCTGCGKNIPFGGEVCPHCHRDKSSDQQNTITVGLAMLFGGWIGNLIGGTAGMIVGGLGLSILVGIISAASKGHSAKKPPLVRVEGTLPGRSDAVPSKPTPNKELPTDTAARLRRLDQLKAEGVISATEHQEQRQAIIGAI